MDVTNQSDTLAAYSAVAVNDKPVALTGQAAIIDRFLTANNLSATTTADGLNYVISFQGTGTLPAKGHTVTMNYSGYILNSKGTEGTEGTDGTYGTNAIRRRPSRSAGATAAARPGRAAQKGAAGLETSNSNIQAPEKLQASNFNLQEQGWRARGELFG